MTKKLYLALGFRPGVKAVYELILLSLDPDRKRATRNAISRRDAEFVGATVEVFDCNSSLGEEISAWLIEQGVEDFNTRKCMIQSLGHAIRISKDACSNN